MYRRCTAIDCALTFRSTTSRVLITTRRERGPIRSPISLAGINPRPRRAPGRRLGDRGAGVERGLPPGPAPVFAIALVTCLMNGLGWPPRRERGTVIRGRVVAVLR